MAKKRQAKQTKKIEVPKPDTKPLKGLLILAFSFALLLSLISFTAGKDTHNWLGLMGNSIGWIAHALFGLGSYIICLFIAWCGYRLAVNKTIYHFALKLLYVALLTLSVCMLLSLIEDQYPAVGSFIGKAFYNNLWTGKWRYHLGGAPFYYLYRDLPNYNLHRVFNTMGVAILFTTTLIASLLFITKTTPLTILEVFKRLISYLKTLKPVQEPVPEPAVPLEQKPSGESDFMRYVKLRIPGTSQTNTTNSPLEQPIHAEQELLGIQPEQNLKVRPSLSRKEVTEPSFKPTTSSEEPKLTIKTTAEKPTPQRKKEAAIAAQKVYNGDYAAYTLPSPNLLTNAKKVDQSSLKKDLRRQAEVLEETLLSFGIEAKVGQINCGPTITSFEVHPSIGVKVQKIKALEDDIALNLEAKSIRIIAPIPGRAAVGIEVPNPLPQEVGFKDMLLSYQQQTRKFHIPVLLGKAVNGDYVMSDLTKMPHCIIAGATGSGKSVCINTIIMTILLTAKPDEIKLLMVDPKKVELTPYTKLPHMLAPVITEPQGACAALQWLVKEMEKRYEILKQIGVRNIDAFNTRTINKELEESLSIEIPTKMHYIVGIIDELADLMMVASSDIETPIARIAQMARAVGIHLILATQRPSREVITGLIKANFPTRISFKVASRVNSQIILDETGAESLLGNGDMLFLPPGSSQLIRAQGAYVRDEDINAVIKHICDQAPPNYVIESFDRAGGFVNSGEAIDDDLDNPKDSLYDQALDIVLSTGNASTTFLQRKLKIGYARAASLMDQLESHGIVGPAEGSKPRKILGRKESNQEAEEDTLLGAEELS